MRESLGGKPKGVMKVKVTSMWPIWDPDNLRAIRRTIAPSPLLAIGRR